MGENAKRVFTNKQLTGLILFIAVLLITFIIPPTATITVAGRNNVGLLMGVVTLLICGTFSMGFIGVLSICLMYFTGVAGTAVDALGGYKNTTTFFIFASYGITMAITSTPIAKRFMRWIILRFGRNTRSVLIAVMCAAGGISAFVSNLPVVTAFIPLGLDYLKFFDDENDKRSAGAALMIGIPAAVAIGGLMTPAGGAMNVAIMDRLNQFGGVQLTFIQWMYAGTPFAVVCIFVAAFILCWVFKPKDIKREKLDMYIESLDVPDHMERNEKYVIFVVFLMFVCWIAGTWIRYFNTTIVCLSGLILFMLPGFGIFDFKAFVKAANWELFIYIGAVIELGNLLTTNGIVAAIVQVVSSSISGLHIPLPILILLLCSVLYVLVSLMPVGPTLAMNLTIPIIGIAQGLGYAPTAFALALGFVGYTGFIVPIDTIPMLGYSQGYFTIGEGVKATIPITIVMIIMITLWIPFCTTVLIR